MVYIFIFTGNTWNLNFTSKNFNMLALSHIWNIPYMKHIWNFPYMKLFISYMKKCCHIWIEEKSYVKLFRSPMKPGISYVNFLSTYEILHFTYEILDLTYELPISYVNWHMKFSKGYYQINVCDNLPQAVQTWVYM